MQSIYLINPKTDAPGYFGAEANHYYGLTPAVLVADLACVTVAAMIPEDFEIEICDENVADAKLDHHADIIAITGKSPQMGGMIRLAKEFRARGKTILIGGPLASLCPSALSPHCDILVSGEIETIAAQLFDDLRNDRWKSLYLGDKPDLGTSPVPRWDLYPNDNAISGCVQTSRGCPFDCEFCDVIQYVGRKQRHKPIHQITTELDRLYGLGYRGIFLADDNFTVYRRRAKEVLRALREWNDRRSDGRVIFSTQVSIDAARDDEILQLCQQAGLTEVFIGIETPNEDSLKETHKRQNIGRDLIADATRFVEHGMSISGGMIVGFDADNTDIFETQYEFAMQAPIAIFTLGALIAPDATPLYDRMASEGRLIKQDSVGATYTPWSTNLQPKLMSQQQLLTGLRWLCNRLYSPQAFGERLLRLIDTLSDIPHTVGTPGASGRAVAKRMTRKLDIDVSGLVRKVGRLGPDEASMLNSVLRASARKPSSTVHVMSSLFRYMQIRHMYAATDHWDPALARLSAPPI